MVTEKDVVKFGEQCANIFAQVSRDVIGQKEVVEGTIIAMIAGGNVLLEGVPGVGKTRLGVLLHRFQQCRLRLGRRSVYFVRQYYVAEYWPRLKLKRRIAACVLHYYIRSRYVSRH